MSYIYLLFQNNIKIIFNQNYTKYKLKDFGLVKKQNGYHISSLQTQKTISVRIWEVILNRIYFWLAH